MNINLAANLYKVDFWWQFVNKTRTKYFEDLPGLANRVGNNRNQRIIMVFCSFVEETNWSVLIQFKTSPVPSPF